MEILKYYLRQQRSASIMLCMYYVDVYVFMQKYFKWKSFCSILVLQKKVSHPVAKENLECNLNIY